MRREARVINFKRSILNSCFACAQPYPHFTQQQRLFSLQNDLAKQKIDLARMTGLPPNDQYEITDDIPFSATSLPSLDEALKRASAQRSDLKAAEAQVRAAERAVAAARTERLPSLFLNGDYGVIGTNSSQSHGTFSVTGTLRFPIWEGGRTEVTIEQAHAALAQRHAAFEDLRLQVESEVAQGLSRHGSSCKPGHNRARKY